MELFFFPQGGMLSHSRVSHKNQLKWVRVGKINKQPRLLPGFYFSGGFYPLGLVFSGFSQQTERWETLEVRAENPPGSQGWGEKKRKNPTAGMQEV